MGDDTNVEKLNTEMSEEIFQMKLKKKKNLMRNALQIQYVVIALQLEKELKKKPIETISTVKSNYLNESATVQRASLGNFLLKKVLINLRAQKMIVVFLQVRLYNR
ncbi:hypothetical protein ABFX02_12G059400 [Erythranthe guttata]